MCESNLFVNWWIRCTCIHALLWKKTCMWCRRISTNISHTYATWDWLIIRIIKRHMLLFDHKCVLFEWHILLSCLPQWRLPLMDIEYLKTLHTYLKQWSVPLSTCLSAWLIFFNAINSLFQWPDCSAITRNKHDHINQCFLITFVDILLLIK